MLLYWWCDVLLCRESRGRSSKAGQVRLWLHHLLICAGPNNCKSARPARRTGYFRQYILIRQSQPALRLQNASCMIDWPAAGSMARCAVSVAVQMIAGAVDRLAQVLQQSQVGKQAIPTASRLGWCDRQ
jgi:hypothetical protein